jgi:hypothetical protein
MTNAGEQLDGKTLYERQKTARSLAGPAVIAANLEEPENIGSVLRVADAAGCAEVILAQDRRLRHRERIFATAVETQNHVPWRVSLVDEFLAGAAAITPSLIAIELTTTSRSVFELALPRARRIYLTEVHADIEGDVVLKGFDESQWKEVRAQACHLPTGDADRDPGENEQENGPRHAEPDERSGEELEQPQERAVALGVDRAGVCQ